LRLTRRELILGAAALPALAAKKSVERCSVLLILVDELGAWMLGCYGNREIRTPNIDVLARSGTRFAHSFASSVVPPACRASLLTGYTPRQLGVSAAGTLTLKDGVLLSDILGGMGYQCGYAGKWDLGPAGNPGHHFTFWETTEDAETATGKALSFLDAQKVGQPYFLTTSYVLASSAAKKYQDTYTKVSFDSIGWQPASPHAAANKDALKDIVGSIRGTAAALTALDDQVQRLIKKVDERGLRDQTLIVFTGTCGALLGRHGLWGDGRATDPVNMYEEVVGVPLIWQWLGHTPPEAVRPEMVSTYDMLPSICQAAGAALPTGRSYAGRSFLPAVRNEPFPKKQPWSTLVFAELGATRMVRDKSYKLVLRGDVQGRNELFDVTNDPRERVNQYANPQFVTVRDPLAADLARWSKQF
jgi:arylsulfatase A-like enzyme